MLPVVNPVGEALFPGSSSVGGQYHLILASFAHGDMGTPCAREAKKIKKKGYKGMKKFLAALMVVVMIFTFSIPKQQANADALVISQLAAAAYAIATSSGMNFSFTSGTGSGAQTFMENRLSSWVSNQTGGINIFGTTPVKALAAKLAITQTAFNALKNFINDTISDLGIGTTSTQLSPGTVGGVLYNEYSTYIGQSAGFWFDYEWTTVTAEWSEDSSYKRGICVLKVGMGANVITSYNYDCRSYRYYYKPVGWKIFNTGGNANAWQVNVDFDKNTHNHENQSIGFTYAGVSKVDVISATVPNGMAYPNVGLDDLQTYKRQDWAPDTNLEQMIDDIFDDVSANDIDLTGETVEDTPVPTPAPTYPPVDDVNQGLGDIVGGLNDLIGTQQGVLEGVNDIAGTLEGTQEAVEGIQEGIGSISEALEIPATSEATQLKLPDLRTLFPFCIPFDIYNIITAFNASPVAPHVQIPFNIPAIGLTYTFDLDFSSYNSVAAVLRTVEFVAYAIGLAILSSKVIRW